MKYFNGFSLRGEEKFFKDILIDSQATVAGFSYGAQKAFEYAYASRERIDRLILISPAFFQTQKPAFIRTQLRYFESDKEAYCSQFLQNVVYPSSEDLHRYFASGIKEELEMLLTYQWDKSKMIEMMEKGIAIEVFLGSKDKIIEVNDAYAFFSSIVTTYLIKDVGHTLLK
ncbi:MAG: pimelyl-ACP methyl ester esterase BioV [Campylobacterales bacterium]|nr:pimelyl-ACP methyl ester esterase BioV [Campylobacterales bacterium]